MRFTVYDSGGLFQGILDFGMAGDQRGTGKGKNSDVDQLAARQKADAAAKSRDADELKRRKIMDTVTQGAPAENSPFATTDTANKPLFS